MKIKINQELKNIDGSPLMNGDNVITLKEILLSSALVTLKDDSTHGMQDFELSLKIQTAKDEIELTSEDVVRLKEKIKFGYTTIIVGQVNYILEGKENPLNIK